MSTDSYQPADVFEPARSFGWVSLLVLLAMVVAPLGMLWTPGAFQGEDGVAALIIIATLVPLDAYLLITLLSLPRMRYELAPETLALSCGPFFRYRIPYVQITEVRLTTLTPTLWSSMRMPGLALGGVVYSGVGNVRMCATRMSRDILLIAAGGKLYGITPADEERFTRALSSRLPRTPASTAPQPGA